MFIKMPQITIDPIVYFKGTEEEIEQMENQEKICEDAWKNIIEKDGFSALGFQVGHNYIFLSHCCDDKGVWRLTWFYNGTLPNGKTYSFDPSMHENFKGKNDGYKGNSCVNLLHALTDFCRKEITVEIF